MSENYDKIVPALRLVLRDKLKTHDKRKAQWDAIMAKGESMMKYNSEQAEAYFAQADELQGFLEENMAHILRLRCLLQVSKKVK